MADELYGVGERIVASCVALGLPLTATKEQLLEDGWLEHHASNGFYASRLDPSNGSAAFLSDTELHAPAAHVAALVREFDISDLAGRLKDFKVVSDTSSELLVDYVSTLPWPFEPRLLHAQMLFGVSRQVGANPTNPTTSALILGRSRTPTAGQEARQGLTLGTIHYSLYRISPTAAASCTLRRVINVDMHLALPDFILRKSLAAHYAHDTDAMRAQLAGFAGGPVEARTNKEPGQAFYETLTAVLGDMS